MIERLLQPRLLELATRYPVLTLTGPRQSGKTTLSRMAFPDRPYVSLKNPAHRELAQEDPIAFLARYGTAPSSTPSGQFFNAFDRLAASSEGSDSLSEASWACQSAPSDGSVSWDCASGAGTAERSKSISSHEAGSSRDSRCVNTVAPGNAPRMSASMRSSRRWPRWTVHSPGTRTWSEMNRRAPA